MPSSMVPWSQPHDGVWTSGDGRYLIVRRDEKTDPDGTTRSVVTPKYELRRGGTAEAKAGELIAARASLTETRMLAAADRDGTGPCPLLTLAARSPGANIA